MIFSRTVASGRSSASGFSQLLCPALALSAILTRSSCAVVYPFWLIVPIPLLRLLGKYVIRLFEAFVKAQRYTFMRFHRREKSEITSGAGPADHAFG